MTIKEAENVDERTLQTIRAQFSCCWGDLSEIEKKFLIANANTYRMQFLGDPASLHTMIKKDIERFNIFTRNRHDMLTPQVGDTIVIPGIGSKRIGHIFGDGFFNIIDEYDRVPLLVNLDGTAGAGESIDPERKTFKGIRDYTWEGIARGNAWMMSQGKPGRNRRVDFIVTFNSWVHGEG